MYQLTAYFPEPCRLSKMRKAYNRIDPQRRSLALEKYIFELSPCHSCDDEGKG